MYQRVLIFLICLLAFYCGNEKGIDTNRYRVLTGTELNNYVAGMQSERAQTDQYFRQHPEAPIAAVARLQVPEKDSQIAQCIIQDETGFAIKSSWQDSALLVFQFDGDRFQVILPASDLKLNQKPYDGAAFTEGVIQGQRYVFAMYPSPVIIIYDLEAPARQQFPGKDYYPIDHRWQLEGKLTRIKAITIIQMPTSRGLVKQFRIYGTVELTMKSNPVILTLYQGASQPPDSDELFLPFTDSTTGRETYGTGRYLDLQAPAAGKPVIVDFNRAYYPLCYYSPHYNCPIPPASNQIPVAVTAGEKGIHRKH